MQLGAWSWLATHTHEANTIPNTQNTKIYSETNTPKTMSGNALVAEMVFTTTTIIKLV